MTDAIDDRAAHEEYQAITAKRGMFSATFFDGFAAGLRHARQWRELTADPATWPAEGQLVVLQRRGGAHQLLARRWDRTTDGRTVFPPDWRAWLPLPEAP